MTCETLHALPVTDSTVRQDKCGPPALGMVRPTEDEQFHAVRPAVRSDWLLARKRNENARA